MPTPAIAWTKSLVPLCPMSVSSMKEVQKSPVEVTQRWDTDCQQLQKGKAGSCQTQTFYRSTLMRNRSQKTSKIKKLKMLQTTFFFFFFESHHLSFTLETSETIHRRKTNTKKQTHKLHQAQTEGNKIGSQVYSI